MFQSISDIVPIDDLPNFLEIIWSNVLVLKILHTLKSIANDNQYDIRQEIHKPNVRMHAPTHQYPTTESILLLPAVDLGWLLLPQPTCHSPYYIPTNPIQTPGQLLSFH